MRVLLVGGSPDVTSSVVLQEAANGCDKVVAIDRGLDALMNAGIYPDLFCGDADSISDEGRSLIEEAFCSASDNFSCTMTHNGPCGGGEPPMFEIERYNPAKDYTDLSLALRAIRERWGSCDVVCTFLSGGKPDHFLGVMGCLSAYDAGAVQLVENTFSGRILHGGQNWSIDGAEGRRLSVIALADGTCVSERGTRWETDHLELPLLSDRGVSNVIDDAHASVICNEGVLVAYLFNEKSPLARERSR